MSSRLVPNRRTFLAGAFATAIAGTQLKAGLVGTPSFERIGFTTVSVRDRIPFRLPGAPTPEPGPMTLLHAPQFAAETVGVPNLEVWNLQFDDTSENYCSRLRSAAQRAGVAITNIQVDGGGDLGSPDPAVRKEALANAHAWIDRAAWIGAPAIRANFSPLSPKVPFEVGPASESFRALADYGRSNNVMILTENHFGHSVQIENVVALLEAVGHPNLRVILDWGNVPDATTESVVAAMHRLRPWLYLVSAKGSVFDEAYNVTTYDVTKITRATEEAGFEGVYSIELFGATPVGFDPIAAIHSMRRNIAEGLAG